MFQTIKILCINKSNYNTNRLLIKFQMKFQDNLHIYMIIWLVLTVLSWEAEHLSPLWVTVTGAWRPLLSEHRTALCESETNKSFQRCDDNPCRKKKVYRKVLTISSSIQDIFINDVKSFFHTTKVSISRASLSSWKKTITEYMCKVA